LLSISVDERNEPPGALSVAWVRLWEGVGEQRFLSSHAIVIGTHKRENDHRSDDSISRRNTSAQPQQETTKVARMTNQPVWAFVDAPGTFSLSQQTLYNKKAADQTVRDEQGPHKYLLFLCHRVGGE